MLRPLTDIEILRQSSLEEMKAALIKQGYENGRANTLIAPDGSSIKIEPSVIFGDRRVWHVTDESDPDNRIHLCFTRQNKVRWIPVFRGRGPTLNLLWLTEYQDEEGHTVGGMPLYIEDFRL